MFPDNKTLIITVALRATLWPAQVHAQDSAPLKAGFEFNQPLYTVSDFKTSGEGTAFRTKTSATTGSATELVVSIENLHVHVFPNSFGAPIQIGFNVLEQLELGLTLARSTYSAQASEISLKTSQLGAFAVFVQDMGNLALEWGASYDSIHIHQSLTDSPDDASNVDMKGQVVGLSLAVAFPVVSNASFVATTAWTQDQRWPESSGGTRLSGWYLTPCGLRLAF